MLFDELRKKILVLHDTVWERRVSEPALTRWLDNFATHEDRLHALHLLCQMMYFGEREVRELLRTVYRDLYRYPIVAQIRRERDGTRESTEINEAFARKLAATRFVCLGSLAESSGHLMYLFRQENELPVEAFLNTDDILVRDERVGCSDLAHQIGNVVSRGRIRLAKRLANPEVIHYVFIDDLCGSGTQARNYSDAILTQAKLLRPDAVFSYYPLVATRDGLRDVRDNTFFDHVEAVFEIDDSYKCFSPQSRYFKVPEIEITRVQSEEMCRRYGARLLPNHPLGYKNGQLLLAFAYNTPDNTLPIVWADQHNTPNKTPWEPIFRRYPKVTWG